ncbi:MAG: ACT domain-containing protein [Pseudomonadota bacterium]
MRGEADLDQLMASMSPELRPGTFVFATVAEVGDLPALMTFQEADGITVILERDVAEAHGLEGAFACRMITLNVHSALDAVGFLARITTALAAKGMGVNPVSAFNHDHLFVPENRAEEAMATLHGLVRGP